MLRLLAALFLATLVLPFATGSLALLAGFGDPWGMGARDPLGIFISAAVPVTVPGIYQIVAWPATFGLALVLSPLVAFRLDRPYRIALLTYLGVIAIAWLACWRWAPEILNDLVDNATFQPGRLNKNVWKFGLYLLVDAAVLAIAVLAWRRRVESRVPGNP
ncbi:MAG: hypothetical protein FIB05_00600 [Betaproteobacteria bacterium]|nr:hypothetical protein [Betaproteobacteria bacterium]PWB62238.1 MAG: hypothetical protein C3F16_07005 [Betaproteobacteria bacterium]